jgi:uncharacterized RDD family membrane protein YckC
VTAYQYPSAASPYPAVSTTDPTAVMGRRSVAFIIDVLLFFLVASFFGPTPLSPFALYEEIPSGFDYGDACEQLMDSDDVAACFEVGGRAYYTDNTDVAVASLVSLAYFLLILGLLQGLKGFTPGKGLLGVRAVDEQGQMPGIGKALGRSILWIVDAAPWIFPLVGLITGFTTKGHRRVGDMAAKTFVIGKADVGRPVIVPGLTTAYAAGYGIPTGYPAPGAPGQPGQPGQSPWDRPTPTPTPGAGVWGTPAGAPGAPGSPAPGSPPGSPSATPGSAAPGQPWAAPATPGSPWSPPSTPSGSPPPQDQRPTPSGDWPTPGAPAPTPTPPGETPAARPAGAAIPLGAVGSTTPSTTDTPDTTTPPSGETTPGSPGSTPAASASGLGAPPSGETPSGETPSGGTPSGETRSADSPSGVGTPSTASASGTPASGESPPAAEPTADTPVSAAAGAPAAAAQQQQASSGYEPQWDAARNTYIVWEPNRRQWLGWDDSAKEWRPL